MITIKSKDGTVLHKSKKLTFREAVEEAISQHISFVGVDFSYAELNYVDLSGINFEGANFIHASLICADLRDSNFIGVRFNGANLSHVKTSGAITNFKPEEHPQALQFAEGLLNN